MSKKFVKVVGIFLFVILLTGCGRPRTLQEFLERHPDELNEVIADVEEEIERMSRMTGIEMFFEMEVAGPDELVFIYVYGPNVELTDDVAEQLEQSLALMATTYERMAAQIRESMNVDAVYITLVYMDYERNVLAESTFAGQ